MNKAGEFFDSNTEMLETFICNNSVARSFITLDISQNVTNQD